MYVFTYNKWWNSLSETNMYVTMYQVYLNVNFSYCHFTYEITLNSSYTFISVKYKQNPFGFPEISIKAITLINS